jgi:hypothetical protein
MARAHVLREGKPKFEVKLSEMNETRVQQSPKVWASHESPQETCV